MKNKTTFPAAWVILNALGFIGVIVVNGLANALPINGKTTGELSDLYPNLFVPAGLTFSIWGIIYLALLGLIIYQVALWFRSATEKSVFIDQMSPWFLINCLANMGWIIAWHHELIGLSLIIMLIILISLIRMYLDLGIGVKERSSLTFWLVWTPISIYLAWITIATIANTTALLVACNWSGWGLGQQAWTVMMILAGAGITLILQHKRRDPVYGWVILWALTGILIKRYQVDGGWNTIIIYTVLFAMAAILLSMLAENVRGRK